MEKDLDIDGIKIRKPEGLVSWDLYDGMILSNQRGKSPLGGFLTSMYRKIEIDCQYEKKYDQLRDKISQIIDFQNEQFEFVRIACIDTHYREFGLQFICLVPSCDSNFYYENYDRWAYWKMAVWGDYVYAVVYFSVLLLSRNVILEKCFMDLWPLASINEDVIRAIMNSTKIIKDLKIRQIDFLSENFPNNNLFFSQDPPKHRKIKHKFGIDANLGYRYVDIYLPDPFRHINLRGSGSPSRKAI